MAQLSMLCPHCLTEQAAFTARHCVSLKPGVTRTVALMQCGVCGKGLVIEFNSPSVHVGQWINNNAQEPGGPIGDIYPKVVADEAPMHTPDNVKSAFLDGLHNLARRKSNPAVAMFRRALEIGVRILDPNAPKGTNLVGRIERLPPDLITPAMKEWAHVVRLGGNEALHDPEEFSEKEAKDLRVFTELFMTYAFMLPAMLKANKGQP